MRAAAPIPAYVVPAGPPPRAFAISDNGHMGCWATGLRTNKPQLFGDPKERALQVCAVAAAKPRMLYPVDEQIVFQPPPAAVTEQMSCSGVGDCVGGRPGVR